MNQNIRSRGQGGGDGPRWVEVVWPGPSGGLLTEEKLQVNLG